MLCFTEWDDSAATPRRLRLCQISLRFTAWGGRPRDDAVRRAENTVRTCVLPRLLAVFALLALLALLCLLGRLCLSAALQQGKLQPEAT